MNSRQLWERYKERLCSIPSVGLSLDTSRMNFPDGYFERMEPEMQRSFQAMDALEAGTIANPDENRMVGHYWLRKPSLAPTPVIRKEIEDAFDAIWGFAYAVNTERIVPKKRRRFKYLLVIGIGGSALGPQFVSDALGTARDPIIPYFIDNTDPDGMDRVFDKIGHHLDETLTIVISKSGGTIETRNGMLRTQETFKKADIPFEQHAVAITEVGSKLYNIAKSGEWLAIFPMWDWIGGRTSELSAVGLLPAMLQGIDTKELLNGASLCDEITRNKTTRRNPAALLALSWYHATGGKGLKDMVVLPYKDRLSLFPKYLQQLIMESLGKEKDLSGNIVQQGITVYGNKGSTDQHAYVQQLRDGVNNYFATFIEVLLDANRPAGEVEPGVTSGDYLSAFLQGTRNALYENDRESVTITLEKLDARSLGALIALYERAVGLYAYLINVNAYHQPGVEAGKKMAGGIIKLQGEVIAHLRKDAGKLFTAEEIAAAIGAEESVESVFKILEHAATNPDHGILKTAGAGLFDSTYHCVRPAT